MSRCFFIFQNILVCVSGMIRFRPQKITGLVSSRVFVQTLIRNQCKHRQKRRHFPYVMDTCEGDPPSKPF